MGGRCRFAIVAALVAAPQIAKAQVDPAYPSGLPIERVTVDVVGGEDDPALRSRVADAVRKAVLAFPGDRFNAQQVELGLAQSKRNPAIRDARYVAEAGANGGVALAISVTLRKPGEPAAAPRFPILFERDGTIVKAKLELLGMAYSNANAWYGEPATMLDGNPLVVGRPAGSGVTAWAEGFVQAGLYGITPLSPNVQLYGGASAIVSASAGRELFTDDTRVHLGVEDAFIGLVGGRTDARGNRLVANASIGRMRFAMGDGFIIANTASNGSDRAALQSNPRWAADLLGLVQVRYNATKVEAFWIDPDELPAVDSATKIWGVNVESRLGHGIDGGLAFLRVPKSRFSYFTPTATFGREGLSVWDVRLRYQRPGGGPFVAVEGARQRNSHFAMKATAYQAEAGWVLAKPALTVSYRYASFSGDDPDTARFERWDPLLSGGNGEQWVQGINHFKIFQDSNLVAHRVQLRYRPDPKTELVPQFWLFRADELLNLGGNPALSFLDSRALAKEVNLTAKRFVSRNFLLQGHVAATFPDRAEKLAVGRTKPWLSAMIFARLGY